MKSILIPAEDHDAMPAVMEAALLVARVFDSYIEGFAVRPSPGTYVTVEPVSSLAITGAYEGEAPKLARAAFEAFMQANGVPQTAGEGTSLSYAWPQAESQDDAYIGSYGRIFDLIALGRPGRAPENPRMAPLEAALFESGDLIIKGAYTQSRLRQMIFGGATRHILANATLPVFMAH